MKRDIDTITFGQVKDYCVENGIELRPPMELGVLDGNVQYGDVNAQVYFNYLIEHSEEIINWLDERDKINSSKKR